MSGPRGVPAWSGGVWSWGVSGSGGCLVLGGVYLPGPGGSGPRGGGYLPGPGGSGPGGVYLPGRGGAWSGTPL